MAALNPEAAILSGLEELKIRDRVPMPRSVYLQIERCNMTISGVDTAIFEANVRGLLTLIPSHKHKDVMDKSDEYNVTFEEHVFQDHCGIQMGSVAFPLMRENANGVPYVVKRDDEDRIIWDDPNIISPQLVSRTETDYEELYKVIIGSLESANITWKVQRKTVEMGRVIKGPVSDSVRDYVAQRIGYIITQYRKNPEYAHLTYQLIVDTLKRAKPSSPTYETEGDFWPKE